MSDHEETKPLFTVGIFQNRVSALVSFSGELDVFAAPNMRQAFLHPDVARAINVQVDLTKATFFDSSALGILVSACKRAREEGGAFGVTCPEGMVRQVLEMSGVVEYLQVSPHCPRRSQSPVAPRAMRPGHPVWPEGN
jgi:anti-sigma B factor antagonist